MKLLFITSKLPLTITAFKFETFDQVFNEYGKKKSFYSDLIGVLIGDSLHLLTLELYEKRFTLLSQAIAVNFSPNDIKTINERMPKY